MAFKSVEEYNQEFYKNVFKLNDDGEHADVIFLYQSKRDVLQADVHYVKSTNYSGYVHCCGVGCPACKKGLKLQSKLFIPVYSIYDDAIKFWDRNYNKGFELQLDKEVFAVSPNPSDCVFTISRKGGYKDRDTRYSFVAAGRNTIATYDQILAKFQAKMPDYYEHIVKSVSASELADMINTNADSASAVSQDYVPVPRAGYQSSIPDTYVNASEVVASPADSNVGGVEANEVSEISDDTDSDLPDPIF